MDYKLKHAQHSHVPGIYRLLLLSISGHICSKFLLSMMMIPRWFDSLNVPRCCTTYKQEKLLHFYHLMTVIIRWFIMRKLF